MPATSKSLRDDGDQTVGAYLHSAQPAELKVSTAMSAISGLSLLMRLDLLTCGISALTNPTLLGPEACNQPLLLYLPRSVMPEFAIWEGLWG